MYEMPLQKSMDMSIEKALDFLEDYTLNTHILRNQNYFAIYSALTNGEHINITDVERLLTVCVHDLKEDKKYTVNVLKVINSILKKIRGGELTHYPDLVPSALAIMDTFLIASRSNVTNLQICCLDTFLGYPDDVHEQIGSLHSAKVIELLKLADHQKLSNDTSLQFLNFIYKLLKILPPDKKSALLKKSLDTWFSVVVPKIISWVITNQSKLPVELLELLTQELVPINYFDNFSWQKCILESICKPDKFPAVMKSQLEKGSDIWHRLWMVFIKLLKNQTTVNNNKLGSPINSMLPVVEMAFKMDIANRCRAFQCWNVLIDNFSSELNEHYVNKRIKLLLIPLKSNNAKVEETAQAKFNTWWHLIKSYEVKLEKLADTVLVPFLHFCFDKPTVSEKPVVIPGFISNNMRKLCAHALVELVGHVDCEGCVSLPRLKGKVIKANLLISHWNELSYCVKTTLKLCPDNELTSQQAHCLWKSLILTIAEVPDSNNKKELLNKLMDLLEILLKECQTNNKLADIYFHVLINLLLCEDKLSSVIKMESVDNSPIHRIVKLMLDSAFYPFYDSDQAKDSVKKLTPLTNIIAIQSHSYSNEFVINLFNDLPVNDNTLMLWTALAETILESQNTFDNSSLHTVIMWPIMHMDKFHNDEFAASMWYALYNVLYPKICKSSISNEISKTIVTSIENVSICYFMIYASIGILKHKINDKETFYEKDIQSLLDLVKKIENLKSFKTALPEMTATLVLVMNKVTKIENLAVANLTISVVDIIWKLIIETVKINTEDTSHMLVIMENLLNAINTLLKKEAYSELIPMVVDELIKYLPFFYKHSSLKIIVVQIMKLVIQKTHEAKIPYHLKIQAAIDSLESGIDIESIKVTPENKNLDKNSFSAPNKRINRKGKKKEPNIVNTVIDHGEEYVVVNTNWKFNPRLLTENQKEKLSRKREDIPALYQDLSVSQDEFKLKTWKQDYQDSSTTNSKSTSKAMDMDLSSILKDSPNIIPHIIGNIMQDSHKNKIEDSNVKDKTVASKSDFSPPVKDPKSPRMTLKDRVFRNLNSLAKHADINVSDINDEAVSEDLLKKALSIKETNPERNEATICDNILQTNTTIKENEHIVNSVPSNISADRPSRVKRAPRKFDDSHMIALKKRRNSLLQIDNMGKCEVPNEFEAIMPNESAERDDSPIFDIDATVMHQAPQVTDIDMESTDINTDLESTNTEIDKYTSIVITDPCETDPKLNTSDSKENPQSKEPNIDPVVGIQSNSNEPLSQFDNSVPVLKELSTPKSTKKEIKEKESVKKNSVKKTRIEKELAIDMVEGHPYLSQSEKRARRKPVIDSLSSARRKSLSDKLNKIKSEMKPDKRSNKLHKSAKKSSANDSMEKEAEIMEKFSSSEDIPSSEDIIESSQDSSLTSVSVKSTKGSKKIPVVTLVNIKEFPKNTSKSISDTRESHTKNDTSFEDLEVVSLRTENNDIELSRNKTLDQNNTQEKLTENMDTEPINDKQFSSEEVLALNDDADKSIIISSEDTCTEMDTQNTANADTQSIDPMAFENDDSSKDHISISDHADIVQNCTDDSVQTNRVFPEPVNVDLEENEGTNDTFPLNDKVQRQKDFLNNTSEISPIKTLSPIEDNRSPSPETSSDYVVIKLSTPVQMNGEPIDKTISPEVFTEEKISPDKRDQSPPRIGISVNSSSPTSSLSLKKNRPQGIVNSRGAQMLGLCLPDRQPTIINSEKPVESEDPKRSLANSQARRNLRILYNSVGENNENSDESEDNENFLKLKRLLPTSDCSPSGPILKRKLAEIADESSISPACKRKRVSFHDPPVSTTVAVQKYIEPSGIRSPQSSSLKRLEKPIRPHANMKSPKRLDTVFKLENMLTKAVESFTDTEITDDTELISLEQTPMAEIVNTSELNDTEPICSELLDCNDPIEHIAADLSSPAMRSLLIKELEGKVETVGDLARMTELEVNRLCIIAPKVKIARKVLTEYAAKRNAFVQSEENNKIDKNVTEVSIEVQTSDVPVTNPEEQETVISKVAKNIQTDMISVMHAAVQTKETCKSSADLIKCCLMEKPDFVDRLCEYLEELSKLKITDSLPFDAVIDTLTKRTTPNVIINQLLDQHNDANQDKEFKFLHNFLCDRYDSKSLILFCSQLLQKIHDKPA